MKKKKGFGFMFGIDSVKNSLSMIKEAVSNEKNNVHKDSIKETFEEALDRLDIKEEDREEYLKDKHNKIRVSSHINYIFSILLIIGFIIISFDKKEYFLVDFFPLLFSFYFLMQGFICAFRCYQIELRELVGLSKFLRNSNKWIAKKKV
tara:strand:+ start:121 stop:567 length:447 start_codon:yes stop_codon:yes gene_type:complete